jgi:hypothetical protein
MSNITFPPTAVHQFTRPLQYVAEGVGQTAFGVTPTASPTFLLAGAITDITENVTVASTDYRIGGSKTRYKQISYGHAYSFELGFSPDNNTLMKYGSEESNGAGTIDESLTFLKAIKINAAGSLVEHFVLYKGCKMNVLDLSIAGQMVECNSSWLCREITVPNTTSGLTTPVLKTYGDLTALPWSHLQNGTNPLTINAITYPCTQFHINWNNNIAPDQMNGSDLIDSLIQGNRDITGDFTVVVGKDLALEGKLRTNPLAGDTASYVLKSTATTSTINMTSLSLHQSSPAHQTSDSGTWRISYNFTCSNAVIA